jgi:hypothetical protein
MDFLALRTTIRTLRQDGHGLEDPLRLLIKRIAKGPYRKRTGRKCTRRSYKPTPKWNAQGRRGPYGIGDGGSQLLLHISRIEAPLFQV